MKVSDYIVRILEKENVTDIFGIPGVGCGHFTDSLRKSGIHNHVTYHEQGAAFAACAYGQATGNLGVAYATSGPGATNLLTGIANAYVDSVPALYIVGDKDLDTLKGSLKVRQKASQEVDIVEMARPVTKWSFQITDVKDVRYALERAIHTAKSDRPGPVLLDIPSSIQRMEYVEGERFIPEEEEKFDAGALIGEINRSFRPLFLVGGGVKQADQMETLKAIAAKCNIPVAATIVCDDELFEFENYVGFIGVDGDVCANTAAATCDLLVSFGARLNIKEIGKNRVAFARQARMIRLDVDAAELEYRAGNEEIICSDLREVIPALADHAGEIRRKETWAARNIVRNYGTASTNSAAFERMNGLVERIPENMDLSVGIGSHRRWFISTRKMKSGWRIFQSAGLASMGYALPASIGVQLASGRPGICIDGDGGLMMNLQELQLICRERLPIAVIVFNNRCLGEIMEFQKDIFNGNFIGTTAETGYLSADYEALAAAFHLPYQKVESMSDLSSLRFDRFGPSLIEVIVPENIAR